MRNQRFLSKELRKNRVNSGGAVFYAAISVVSIAVFRPLLRLWRTCESRSYDLVLWSSTHLCDFDGWWVSNPFPVCPGLTQCRGARSL